MTAYHTTLSKLQPEWLMINEGHMGSGLFQRDAHQLSISPS